MNDVLFSLSRLCYEQCHQKNEIPFFPVPEKMFKTWHFSTDYDMIFSEAK